MSQLSKREEVWMRAYAASVSNDSAQPELMANIAVKKFEERFPEIKVWDRQLFLLKLNDKIRDDNTPTSFFTTIKTLVDNVLEFRKNNSQL